ncbi:MAG: D-alanyl-D-alanine carboxypeptidase [Fimbriimonadaceae bacterium]|nr:D-alanyl-D-alanine carboxypeptidase [Fimbriimonadaceae bacterium]
MIAFLLAASIAARIDPILQREILRGASVGVCVTDDNGRVIYERNSNQRLTPASNEKILSVAYALAVLGPEFTPKTRIWKSETAILVDASGHPDLTSGQLKSAAGRLGTSSVVKVKSAYDVGWPSTWEWDDLPHRYAPAIHSFSCDGGYFELFVQNGRAEALPTALASVIVRRGFSSGALDFQFNPVTGVGFIIGTMPRSRTSLGRFAQPKPPHIAAQYLSPGSVVTQTIEPLPNRSPEVIIEGTKIGELAKECLEPSDNYLAEHLFLMAAGKDSPLNSQNEYADARERMMKFYQTEVGLAAIDMQLYDGSGMSRHNQITPLAITKVLNWARKQSWGPVFFTALADSGEGTLANRLQTVRFTGKTGTLNAVNALSGYLRRPDGSVWTVSLLMNQTVAPAVEIRRLQDDIVRELAKVD